MAQMKLESNYIIKQVKAKLVGKDAVTDIAVLKIENTKGIKAIQFANSSKVQTGDSVFAMGNPLGLQFANSVTSGIISASERTIDAETTEVIQKSAFFKQMLLLTQVTQVAH